MKREQILHKVQELVVGQLACDIEKVQENESFESKKKFSNKKERKQTLR